MENNVRNVKVEYNDFQILQNECRKKKEFIDVQLQIGGQLFDAHRIVLSLYSPVLKTMLSEQWSTTKICPISDEYVDVEIVEELLSFLYTGCIELTPDNAHTICIAAHFLQIESLLQPCVEFLCELISVDNVLTLLSFSITCHLEVLWERCLKKIIANYPKFVQNPEILQLGFGFFKSFIVGLKCRSWKPLLREEIFDFIVRWTEQNVSERLEHLPILLENIPLDALPTEFLEETVSTHPLVKECLDCSKIVSKAISKNEVPPKTDENFVVIGGYADGNETFSRSMFRYDSTGTWKQLPDISEYKSHFAATVMDGGNIIISGGYTSESTKTRKVETFNWSTQTWMSMPPMSFKMAGHSMAELNGVLYVAGEQKVIKHSRIYNHNNKMISQNIVLSYSFESQQWSDIRRTELPSECKHLIPYDNHLYALGTSHFEKYDPASNQWTVLTPPKADSVPIAATLHQDKFYLRSFQGFEAYDPETNDWISLPAPAVESQTCLLSVNGKLLAVGGRLASSLDSIWETDSIYEFDLRTKQWKEFGKLPMRLTHHQGVVGQFH